MTTQKNISNKAFDEMTISEKHLVVYAILKKFDVAPEVLEFEKDRAMKAAKKSAKAKSTLSKTQEESLAIKTEIVDFLSDGKKYRATEIANAVGVSVQKASAMLRQMTIAEQVARVQDGKVTTFHLVQE